MKNYYDISLATYSECKKLNGGKWFCPQCGKKSFVVYLDSDRQIINEKVGKCDRADKCAYHYTPKEYFRDNGNDRPITHRPKPKVKNEPSPTYFDIGIFKKTRRAYEKNNLIIFLKRKFKPDLIVKAIIDYHIGTSKHFDGGSTVFWQIDRYGNIRGGKIMKYNPDNGKRVKKPFNHITWVHSVMNLKDYNLQQCLFGEHLLKKYPDRTVAVVESEKTAIIASITHRNCVFLACGGCQNLNEKRCVPLKNRNVVFFPDNGKYDEWSEKVKSISHLFKAFKVSRIMEHQAEELGEDIGDLILRNPDNANIIPELTVLSETHENAEEEREEEKRTTEHEESELAPERTANNDSRRRERSCNVMHISTILDKWKDDNPAFANLCERLDLVAADSDTYYFDESGKFHFRRTPEQELMIKRDYKTDTCPY